MLSPISTSSLYTTLGSMIDTSQTSIANDAEEVASGKISTDLAGYGASAGTLTATNSLASRLSTYVTNAQGLSAKLSVQDSALTQVSTAAQSATTAVQEAVATGTGAGLLQALQAQMSSAADALNTQYGGQYLFSAGNAQTAPVATTTLTGLASYSPATSVFTNGSLKSVSRIDDNQTVQTGVAASDVGSPLMTALASVQAYDAGPNGPLSGTLTQTQMDFLNGVAAQLQSATDTANTAVADNGNVQKQVTDATTSLTAQQTAVKGVISNMTVPDEAQVASDLTLAQTTLQASAQVFSTLQSASLLQVLSSTS